MTRFSEHFSKVKLASIVYIFSVVSFYIIEFIKAVDLTFALESDRECFNAQLEYRRKCLKEVCNIWLNPSSWLSRLLHYYWLSSSGDNTSTKLFQESLLLSYYVVPMTTMEGLESIKKRVMGSREDHNLRIRLIKWRQHRPSLIHLIHLCIRGKKKLLICFIFLQCFFHTSISRTIVLSIAISELEANNEIRKLY